MHDASAENGNVEAKPQAGQTAPIDTSPERVEKGGADRHEVVPSEAMVRAVANAIFNLSSSSGTEPDAIHFDMARAAYRAIVTFKEPQ